MALFALAMAALIFWLVLGGTAGQQRGLVFKNLTNAAVVLRFDDGRSQRLGPNEEQTFPVKPKEFPQAFHVMDENGGERYSQEYRFEQFKEFEFRIGIGPDGFLVFRPPAE